MDEPDQREELAEPDDGGGPAQHCVSYVTPFLEQ
jgi:hypothetical protein